MQQRLRYRIPISPKMVHPISPKRTACSSASLSPFHIPKKAIALFNKYD
ncbi:MULTISPECIES: hypothetical protein [Nostocales]|nr:MULTISPECIES: hypothetical protein [Nostocales]MBO1064380.1 hypothetical protein [Anabaena sp. 54]